MKFSVQEDILAEVGKAEGDSGAYLEQISRSGNSIPGSCALLQTWVWPSSIVVAMSQLILWSG